MNQQNIVEVLRPRLRSFNVKKFRFFFCLINRNLWSHRISYRYLAHFYLGLMICIMVIYLSKYLDEPFSQIP
jgi:hypothetical protein